jgi:general secretion pathway protein K
MANRGGALLAVLWLSAALSAIAFSVANTVRAETERSSTDSEALRAYYLASGAVERALLWIEWGAGHKNPDGSPRFYADPMPVIFYQFPTGDARVEIIPESSKLNINTAKPEDLEQLLLAIGVMPEAAQGMVAGILDWRSAAPDGSATQFDQIYLSMVPSFRARHSSFQEIEELLLVRGMTSELFYGGYWRNQAGQLIPHAALRDCLSVYGSGASGYDVNTTHPAVLSALGLDPDQVRAIVEMRRSGPIRSMEALSLLGANGAISRLRIGGGQFLTIRSTARLRLGDGKYSDLRRTVAAMVEEVGTQYNPPYFVMRWYDNAPTDETAWSRPIVKPQGANR